MSVGSSGDPGQVGLGSGPGLWASVELVGAMSTLERGKAQVLCIGIPGEPYREMKGPCLQSCDHFLCPHICIHTNTYTPNTMEQFAKYICTYTHTLNTMYTQIHIHTQYTKPTYTHCTHIVMEIGM